MLAARGGDPLAVGLHRSHARDHEGCVEPLLQGLLELVRAGSRRTSLRIASRLQVHLQQLPDTPAVAALRLRHALLHARARVNAGQPEAAQAAFEHALVLATAGRARTSCGEARTGLATLALNAGRLDEAEVQLDLAHGDLAGASADADRELAAHAHAVHGRVLFYRGRATQGLRHLQSALRELPASNADLMCHYLIDLARMEALLYHYPTALKTLHKVEQERAARHLPRVAMRLHLYRGQIKALLGDDGCTADLAAALDAAANLGLPVFAARAHLFLGERAFWRYRDDEARRELRKSAAAATAGNDQLALTLANIHLMRLGEAVEDPAPMVAASGMPSLRLALLLAQAHAAGTSDDAASAQDPGQEVAALVEEADLPLSLHLRALTFGNRLASLRSLVRSIAERLDRTRRRSFLAEWQRGARI
jgi:tetratricopeptide (TPR) repeat protein